MRGLLLVSCKGIPVPPLRTGELSHAVFLWQFHFGTRWSNTKNVIPTFPKFKPIEWADREAIEHFTNEFPPYSDFNFASLYSWNTRKKMMVSQLHHNLVIVFYDYISDIPFLTFIGKNNLVETATQLIEYSRKHYHTGILQLIPEFVAMDLPEKTFAVIPDENSFDYIYSVQYLASFDDCNLTRSGNYGVRCYQDNINLYPHLTVKNDTQNNIKKAEYIDLFRLWAKSRSLNYKELNEYGAFENFIQNPNLVFDVVSIYDAEKLIGFSTYEIVQSQYAIHHFSKTEAKYKGLNERLHFEMGKVLREKNIEYLNVEQDLGLPGLRQSKRKFKPVFFLKKFTVELK